MSVETISGQVGGACYGLVDVDKVVFDEVEVGQTTVLVVVMPDVELVLVLEAVVRPVAQGPQ